MLTARLAANSSEEYIELSPTRFENESVECEMNIRIRNWNSSRQEESWTTISTNEIKLSLPDLKDLNQKIENWLDSSSVGVTAFCGHFRLGCLPHTLDFLFEPRPDTIASNDKSVVTIHLSFGTTRVEFRFVTDQSCLGLFSSAISDLNAGSNTVPE